MTEIYLFFKWLHLFSVLAWAGAMLALPWMFVVLLRMRANPDKEIAVLELIRLFNRRIINWAMVASYLTGGALLYILVQTGGANQGWLHSKITLAVALSACHGFLARNVRLMLKGQEPASLRAYQLFALVITLLIAVITYLATNKPF